MKVILSDVLDEERARVRLGLDARLTESLGDPGHAPALRDVVQQQIAALRTGFGDRRVLLDLHPDQREHRLGCRRGKVRRDRFDVCRLPSAGRRPVVFLLATVDVGDEDEARVTEKAAGVTEVDNVLARDLERGDDLDRLVDESGAEPLNRMLDLGSVAPRDEVRGLQRGPVAHFSTVLDAPYGR